MHESLVVRIRKDDPLSRQLLLSPRELNGRLGNFSDPRHHLQAHLRLFELDEQGIKPRMFKPISTRSMCSGWSEKVCVSR
jgi:hypothetical protein